MEYLFFWYRFPLNTHHLYKELSCGKIPHQFNLPYLLDGVLNFNKPEFYLYKNKQSDYLDFEIITDYFIEPSRMKASRGESMSPEQEWIHDKNKFYTFLKNKKLKINDYNLREAIYKLTKEVSHEKVHFTSALFHLLNIKNKNLRIFDACAGWGDRYIASFIVNAKRYIGVEPNENSREGFREMCETFGGDENHKIYEDYMPQFNVTGKFDICFLSPPSYTSENYGDSDGQSVVLFPKRTEWTFNFLYQTISKCIHLLDDNSFLIVQSILIPEIFMYIQYKHPDLIFLGSISVQCSSTRNKPMWIWIQSKNYNPQNLQKVTDWSSNFNPIIKDVLENKNKTAIITSRNFTEYPNAFIAGKDEIPDSIENLLFYNFIYKKDNVLELVKKYNVINSKFIEWNLRDHYLDDLEKESIKISKKRYNSIVSYIHPNYTKTNKKNIEFCDQILSAFEKLIGSVPKYCKFYLNQEGLVKLDLISPEFKMYTVNLELSALLI